MRGFMEDKFRHLDLRLITPPFESEITDLIIDLNYLRRNVPRGSTPPHIFFQIKNIFHMLESIGSARIEGNRTTIYEYIETKIEQQNNQQESFREIFNMESALAFIDDHINDYPSINRMFLSELHKIVVKELAREGSENPGDYRKTQVKITGSNLVTPDCNRVPIYMDELIDFINHDDPQKYDLLKTALAHHRFAWIHPFDNGNGRTVRLLTYAMLVKQGFRVNLAARILNPTAVFCCDRNKYYASLARADKGDNEGLLGWCVYMLDGLKREITKVDNLSNYDYVKSKILIPAINFANDRKIITNIEFKILGLSINNDTITNSDIKKIFPSLIAADISRLIRKLREKKMLVSEQERTRKYKINFDNNYLLRGIIDALSKNGFLPVNN
jgi:Fic family protein